MSTKNLILKAFLEVVSSVWFLVLLFLFGCFIWFVCWFSGLLVHLFEFFYIFFLSFGYNLFGFTRKEEKKSQRKMREREREAFLEGMVGCFLFLLPSFFFFLLIVCDCSLKFQLVILIWLVLLKINILLNIKTAIWTFVSSSKTLF